jgi:hypothetical protein
MYNETYQRDSNFFIAARHSQAAAQILADSGFEIETDENGNIVNFYIDGEGIYDDETLFQELAPYMHSGSYIEFCNEMGDIWRRVFDGESVDCVYAVVVWPKPGEPTGIRNKIYAAFGPHLMEEELSNVNI